MAIGPAILTGAALGAAVTLACAGELSAPLEGLQRATVADQTCESDWPAYLAQSGDRAWAVDGYTRLHALPCSRRDPSNPSYRLYAEFAEAPPVFRALRLPLFELDGRLTARDELYDFQWDQGRREITSTYRPRGRPDCGSRMVYAWDDRALAFSLARAYLKPGCDGRQSPWPRIFPAR